MTAMSPSLQGRPRWLRRRPRRSLRLGPLHHRGGSGGGGGGVEAAAAAATATAAAAATAAVAGVSRRRCGRENELRHWWRIWTNMVIAATALVGCCNATFARWSAAFVTIVMIAVPSGTNHRDAANKCRTEPLRSGGPAALVATVNCAACKIVE